MIEELGSFKHFAQDHFKLDALAWLQKDTARDNPEVTSATIFKALVTQPALGIKSLLRLDQRGRWQELKTLLDSRRPMAGSDTTYLNALRCWMMEPTIEALYSNHLRLKQEGLAATWLSTGRRVLLSIMDGSSFGGFDFSVLAVAGGIPHVIDLEPSPGRGHELKTSRQLMKGAIERLGKGFASHLLYDGLMACKADFWRAQHYWGMHLVVKTSEESLEITQSTKEVWSSLSERDLKRAGVEIISGVDAKQGVSYQVHAQPGIPWVGSALRYNVAWVQETHLKGKFKGKTFEFWVLTTDETLTAAELREIAHNRWSIENNQFKETNEQVGSKRAYIKDPTTKEACLRMWFLGMALLKEFMAHLKTLPGYLSWGVKKTKGLAVEIILRGFPSEVLASHAPP